MVSGTFTLIRSFFSIVSAVIFLFIFSRVAKNATTGVPGKMQCLVEIVVGWVDGIVKETFMARVMW